MFIYKTFDKTTGKLYNYPKTTSKLALKDIDLSMTYKKIDLETFKQKYLVENLTIKECSSFFDCGSSTIVRFCKKNNITKPKELVFGNISKKNTKHNHKLIQELYFNKNLTKKQIAERLNIKEGGVSKIIALSNKIKTKEQKKALQHKLMDKDELHRLYIEENKSLKELQDILEVGETALLGALNRFNIKKPQLLRRELVIKAFVESGKCNTVDGKTVNEISKEINLSNTSINKFLRNNLGEDSILMDRLRDISQNSKNCLEESFQNETNIPFYNKKNELGYKPDFKINEDTYINVDGLYWHSEIIKNDNKYHFNMRKKYEESNKRVLQFREDEVNNKINIVKSMICNITNKNITTVYARKCTIKEVSSKEACIFLENNHLMGKIKARHIGLYLQDELVSLFSYKKYNDKLKVERFCSKINTRVIGGFSKLLKNIEKTIKPSKVEYWVDLRYGTGNYLSNLGFRHSHDTLGWKWTDFKKTYNRMYCRAKDGVSERENAIDKGICKIYDAGQRLYVKEYRGVCV